MYSTAIFLINWDQVVLMGLEGIWRWGKNQLFLLFSYELIFVCICIVPACSLILIFIVFLLSPCFSALYIIYFLALHFYIFSFFWYIVDITVFFHDFWWVIDGKSFAHHCQELRVYGDVCSTVEMCVRLCVKADFNKKSYPSGSSVLPLHHYSLSVGRETWCIWRTWQTKLTKARRTC
jgi:hypothetical protein